jgi:hypothetical protein
MVNYSVHFEMNRLEANAARELGYQIPIYIWNKAITGINTGEIERLQMQIKRCLRAPQGWND